MGAKKRKLFFADYCLTPHQRIDHCGILCEGDKILAIGSRSAFLMEKSIDIVDLSGCYATPGLIDTHLHGAGGFDASCAGKSDIKAMQKTLCDHGVTSFVPTVVAAPLKDMLKNIGVLADMIINSNSDGACPVGIHVEGPFLSIDKRGALKKAYLKKIDLGFVAELIKSAKSTIKVMTFAPELDNSLKLIELLRENNVQPSMGHSIADAEIAKKAVDAGATRSTHIFNGMPALHQRDMSITAVALTDDRVTVELILDQTHLHPTMFDIACRCKPRDKVVGISDAIAISGCKTTGESNIGDVRLLVKDNVSKTEDGILAGTTTLLGQGWQLLMNYSHLEPSDAISCVSYNAAKSIMLDDRGELEPGKRADISFFDSETNIPRFTVCNGKNVFVGDE